jgi:hypothetical protein
MLMSLILALRSNHGVVVAADSQRVERDGNPAQSPFDKTWTKGANLIGAYAGLLEFHGATVAAHINTLHGLGAATEVAGERVAALLRPLLESITEGEFASRRLDVILASRRSLTSGVPS